MFYLINFNMKKILTMVLIATVAIVSSSINAGTPINQSELPKAALTFVAKHFPNEQIRKVEKDNGRRGMEYEIDFASGAEIEFNANGEWKDIKAAHGNSIPVAIIPSAIYKYVGTNFSGQSIVEISRKRGGYEVELSNGSELKLTENAQPMQAHKGGYRK